MHKKQTINNKTDNTHISRFSVTYVRKKYSVGSMIDYSVEAIKVVQYTECCKIHQD